MLRLIVYKYADRYWLATLGCCRDHQTKADIFTEGGEEEIFTITRADGASSIELLRQLVVETEKHNITDIEVVELYIDSRLEKAFDQLPHLRGGPHKIH